MRRWSLEVVYSELYINTILFFIFFASDLCIFLLCLMCIRVLINVCLYGEAAMQISCMS